MADTKVVNVTVALSEELHYDLEEMAMVIGVEAASVIECAVKEYVKNWRGIENEFEDDADTEDVVEVEIALPVTLYEELRTIKRIAKVKAARLIEYAVRSYVTEWYSATEIDFSEK